MKTIFLVLLALLFTLSAHAQCGRQVLNPTTGKLDCIGVATPGSLVYADAAPAAGNSQCFELPYALKVTGWRVRSVNNVTGSLVAGVTVNGSSIVASAPPTMTNATSASGSVSTWTGYSGGGVQLAANDLVCVSLTSASGVTAVQVTLGGVR